MVRLRNGEERGKGRTCKTEERDCRNGRREVRKRRREWKERLGEGEEREEEGWREREDREKGGWRDREEGCMCFLIILNVRCACLKSRVLLSQIEDHSQSFYAKALMDRECPYDQTALSFKVSTCWNRSKD